MIDLKILIIIKTHSLILNVEPAAGAEQGASCLPADEERAEKAVSHVSEANPSEEVTSGSQQSLENMEVEKEDEKREATPSAEKKILPELIHSGSDGMLTAETLSKNPPKLSAPVDNTEHLPMANQLERNPCHNPQSSSPLSSSVDTREALSAVDMEGRSLPQSEEDDEEEEDDELMREGHNEDKEQDQDVKPELLLDEMSNMSHGDESSSGFLGSPGEPDPQLSMDLDLVPAGHSHPDNLLTETDDSLPFEALRSDREKVKRRGSPGRSRVKQVQSPLVFY